MLCAPISNDPFPSSFQFQDFRFLCPNDTVFDQQHLVCTNWFEVDCQEAVALFLNDFGHKETKEDEDVREEEEDFDYEDQYDYYSFKEEDDDDRRFGGGGGGGNLGGGRGRGGGSSSSGGNRGQQQGGQNRFLGNSSPASSSPSSAPSFSSNGGRGGAGGNRDAGRGLEQSRGGFRGGATGNELGDGGFDSKGRRPGGGGFNGFQRPTATPRPPPSTTAIPVGVSRPESTTRRTKPRVKSDILAAKHNAGNNKRRKNKFGRGRGRNQVGVGGGGAGRVTFNNQGRQQGPAFRQPQVRPDGKKPRVKSNLRGRERSRHRESPRTKLGNRVTGAPRKNVKFVSPTQQPFQQPPQQQQQQQGGGRGSSNSFNNLPNDNNGFGGPEVRPDGRPPRVKSDILAKKKNRNRFGFNRRPVVTSTPSPFHLIPKDESFEDDYDDYNYFDSNSGGNNDLGFPSSTLSPFVAATQRPPKSQFSPRPPPTLIPPFSSTPRSPVRPTQPPRRPQGTVFPTRRPPVTLLPQFSSSTRRPVHPASTRRPAFASTTATTTEAFDDSFLDSILVRNSTKKLNMLVYNLFNYF